MKIASIEVWDFSPGFRDGPYVMSHVTQQAAYGRILRIRTPEGGAEGVAGLGEIVYAPTMMPQERARRIAAEREFLPRLIGREIGALTELCRVLRDRGKPWRGVAFGLETAALDLRARACGRPLVDLIGGARSEAVEDYFSISERSHARIRARLAEAGPGRPVIQLKLGIGTLEDDCALVAAVLEALGPEQRLLADANGGWSRADAAAIIARFDDPRLLWEEPCASYDDNAALAASSGRPLLFDQCVGDPETATRAVADGLAAGICIKPAFLGGLSTARRIRDRCAEAGLAMRIDGPWCGDIATAAILHLALGAPPDLLISGCDLREPLLLAPDLKGVVARRGARIAPRPGPGLAIDGVKEALGRPAAVYA